MRLYFENIDCQHEKPIEECGEMYWICNCYEGSNDLDGKGVLGERPVIFGEESASLMNKCTNLLNIVRVLLEDRELCIWLDAKHGTLILRSIGSTVHVLFRYPDLTD
ncbi:unnamed protein product [Toxocara canis]|uniref:Ovule protein n=1 Tax=Toxocara canis TaxID=6265 RepID=A0A183TY99_TOXCA|nr:unnamed protein product [Toxocara canis]